MKRRNLKTSTEMFDFLSLDMPKIAPVFNMNQLLKHDGAIVHQYLDDELIEKLICAHVNNYMELLFLYENMDSMEYIINAANTEWHGKPLKVTPDEKAKIEALLRFK
jgi:hypothetical protein